MRHTHPGPSIDGMTMAIAIAATAMAQSAPEQGSLGATTAPLDGPLVTDRPDFTESASTVPVGRAQLEFGYTFTYDDGDDGVTRGHGLPEGLIRLGLAENFELRIGLPDYAFVSAPGGDDDGLTDSSIGAKLRLFEQQGARPETALIVEASLPTGHDGFTSDGVDPGVILALAWDLGDGWGLAVNGGAFSVTEDDGGREEYTASGALAIPLGGPLGAFVEYFGIFTSGSASGGGPQHYADGGLTWLVHHNLQLDVRVGVGLNDRADDLFAGAGFAIRF